MTELLKSQKLHGVLYDIRGPVLDHANRLEDEGHKIIKLNIGNPGAFGFDAPDEIIRDVIHNIREGQGYCHSKGPVCGAQGHHAALPGRGRHGCRCG